MGLFHDKPSWQNPFYSLREEIINSVTHGIGAVLSTAGLIILVVLAVHYGDIWQVVGFSIFGASLLALYLASTLYHAIQHRPLKNILRRCDHAAVYLLIAGTYTPFLLISLRGTIGVPLLAVIWIMALIGVLWKIFFTGRYEVIATIVYVLMGWMSLLAYRQMAANIPPLGLILLIRRRNCLHAGGVILRPGESALQSRRVASLCVRRQRLPFRRGRYAFIITVPETWRFRDSNPAMGWLPRDPA